MGKLSWLKSEVAVWQREGVVSAEQASAILARYSGKGGAGWARLMFSVIGAVLFGLGIILFFAWNWESMSKEAKLSVIFVSLLGFQLGGTWFRFRGSNHPLSEGLSALGTVLFGAGMILIAQIYHIDEHFPNVFVVWGVAALAMAWSLPSVTQGFLAVFLLILWFASEMWGFDQPMHMAAPIIGLGLLPLAWRQRSSWLFVVATLAFLFTLLVSTVDEGARWLFVDGVLLAVGLILLSPLVERSPFPQVAGTIHNLGLLGYLLILYIFSFDDAVHALRREFAARPQDWIYFSLLLFVALVAFLVTLKREMAQRWDLRQLHIPLLVVSAGLVVGGFFYGKPMEPWLWIAANVIILLHASLWIVVGSREQHGRVVATAALLFALVAIPRFLDLFESLLTRALMFALLGAGLFLLGNFYQRKGKARSTEGQP